MSVTSQRRDETSQPGSSEQASGGSSDTVTNLEIVYSPASELRRGSQVVTEICRGFASGRELAGRLLQRNLRGMYRQTLLGVAWAFLPPLANALIWVFLNSQRVLGLSDKIPVAYPLYVLTGMIVWQSFVEAIQMPLNVVRQNRGMLTKLNFPREALLLVGWGELLLNLAIRLLVLVPLLFLLGANLGWPALVFPLSMLFVIILGSAIGLCLMPVGVLYQDVERLLVIGLPLWMIVTPIIYSISAAMPRWFHWLNPAAGLVVLSRDSLIQASLEQWPMAGCYATLSLPLFAFGLIVYRTSLPILIERMPN
jgi:lipopolysaccharide transport system permease protein